MTAAEPATLLSAPAVDDMYRDNASHLRDELRRLDLLILMRLDEEPVRGIHPDPISGNTINRDEASSLLGQPPMDGHADGPDSTRPSDPARQLRDCTETIHHRLQLSTEARVPLTLPRLGSMMGLSEFEMQALVVCLAPELRPHYDRLYAYLQDDITRQRPSVDLILALLCRDEPSQWAARTLLTSHGRLRRLGILRLVPDPQSPSGSSGLAEFLQLDPRILDHLLGDDLPDERLDGVARLIPLPAASREDGAVLPPIDVDVLAQILNLLQARLSSDSPHRRKTVLQLSGPSQSSARELARHACVQLGVPLLSVDGEALASAPNAPELVRLALREGLLLQCAIHLERAHALAGPGGRSLFEAFSQSVTDYGWLVITSGDRPWTDPELLGSDLLTTVVIPPPSVAVRARGWQRELAGEVPDPHAMADLLAAGFLLTPAQIRASAHAARMRQLMRPGHPDLTFADLTAACREGSEHRLGELATKVEARHGWSDLVLPPDQIAMLREISGQVRHRHRIFNNWGFGRGVTHGTGLCVLFSGPPGTGKTLAAAVLSGDIGLDLYRVDPAQVVSKYIGETEKNLATVFAEAQASNAILLFDEADALFGKRSTVTDAHDRYANIEISYLLQRMEDHEGAVVLATNLRQNLDDAFTRRIRFIVDFPFPNTDLRQQIWRAQFPPEAPVSPDLDFAWLAENVQLAGGNIKNIVLNAAFLAAEDGGIIRPEHLRHSVRREFDKVGKVWSDPR